MTKTTKTSDQIQFQKGDRLILTGPSYLPFRFTVDVNANYPPRAESIGGYGNERHCRRHHEAVHRALDRYFLRSRFASPAAEDALAEFSESLDLSRVTVLRRARGAKGGR